MGNKKQIVYCHILGLFIIAARICGSAEKGSVLVSESTAAPMP
ncbi:hypothetical protein [Desulfobacter vibrioformis]|nr:hypothetical protein [Desulfobacter vibrioformis]